MELKRNNITGLRRAEKLLIVPYGIETPFIDGNKRTARLLIVPYGIKTMHCLLH